MTPDEQLALLLELRHQVPDGVLLDWLDLKQWLQPPCRVKAAQLMERWYCSQPGVSRRLKRLRDVGLISCWSETGRGGAYHVHSLECEQM